MKRETLVSYQISINDLNKAVKAFVIANESDPDIRAHIVAAQYCDIDWQIDEGGRATFWFGVDGVIEAKSVELTQNTTITGANDS